MHISSRLNYWSASSAGLSKMTQTLRCSTAKQISSTPHRENTQTLEQHTQNIRKSAPSSLASVLLLTPFHILFCKNDSSLGIKVTALQWFTSCLSDRKLFKARRSAQPHIVSLRDQCWGLCCLQVIFFLLRNSFHHFGIQFQYINTVLLFSPPAYKPSTPE